MPPRLIHRRPELNDYVIYTDAPFIEFQGGSAAVVSDLLVYRFWNDIRAEYVIRSYDFAQTDRIIDLFRDASTIFGLKLDAVTVSISQLRYFLMSRIITIYVDNNAVLGGIS